MNSTDLIKLIESYIDKPSIDKLDALEQWISNLISRSKLEERNRLLSEISKLETKLDIDCNESCISESDIYDVFIQ